MESKQSKILWGLWCVGVVSGLALSAQRTARVNELKRTHRDVKAKAGLLKVDDPTKVYVTQVINPVIPLALQKKMASVWQFEIHLPIGYGKTSIRLSSPISANGLRNRGGTSSSSSAAEKEITRGLWTMTLQKEDDQWTLSSSGPSGSGKSYLRDLSIESIDDLIVDTICPEPGKTVEIAPERFFNLFRLRTSEEVKNRRRSNKKLPLYPGVAIWMGPQASRTAFEAVRSGSEIPEKLARVILND